MKKACTLVTFLILGGSIVGQSTFNNTPYKPMEKAILPTTGKPHNVMTPRAAGPFSLWVEPVGDVMTQKGVDLTGATSGQSQGTFLSVVYQDSTVRISSPSSTRFVSDIILGSVLDPKSPNLLNTYEPIATKSDAYTVDSIIIVGSYVKKTAAIDTLYTWLVWGDSSNTSVFSKRLTNSVWVSPISTWRKSVIGPKVTGAIGAAGNKVKAAAPTSNQMLVKYVLTNSDSSSAGYSKYITVALPSPANVPAGNLVSCFYTFVPGGVYVAGDCSYAFTGAAVPQNINGFGGIIWGQTSPQVNAVTDYQSHQVDPQGWNMGASYNKEQRHLVYSSSYSSSFMGDLVTAPVIYYKISGTNTTNIDERNNNFSLDQNTPNPFTDQTKINYQLKSPAKSVSLVIYDITGVKMFEKIQANVNAGAYSVDVNDVKFSSGIYFYSLTVDGNKVTRKMVVANK